jgi:integrase|nr:MAG TPA: Integrase [Bacteriophage sp.]
MAGVKEYRKKDGTINYEFQVYAGINPITGKQIVTRRRGFATSKEAELELAKINLAIAEGTFKVQEPPRTFKEIAEIWLPNYKSTVEEVTYTGTLSILKLHVYPDFGDIKVDKIDVTYCQKMVNKWADEQPSSFKKFRNYTSKVLDYAVNIGLIDDNPMNKVLIPRVKKEKRETPFYTKDELKHFLELAKQYDPTKIYTFFRLLSYSGMRKGEAYALNWDDIDFEKNQIDINKSLARGENKTIYISAPKNKSSIRKISMDKETMGILKRWQLEQRKQLFALGHPIKKEKQELFSTDENDLYQPTVDAHWKKGIYRLDPEFKKINTHGFRHTHASLLFEAGASIKEVQDRLGHADIATTMNIYAHVTEAKRDETADKFFRYLNE